jgi:succinyl-diaminopimelate desuccinylase
MIPLDPIVITQSLIQMESITPHAGDTLNYLKSLLIPMGFTIEEFFFHDVSNLYATFGNSGPHICFLGHVDVVPIGNGDHWTYPPFSGVIHDDVLYGRGAVDMKGGIGSFVAAVSQIIPHLKNGKISILLTSDEEGPAHHGVKEVVHVFKERNEKIDLCIVGEPTNLDQLGAMIKIGRRGSFNATIKFKGVMGHVAYPTRCSNPIPSMLSFLAIIQNHIFDAGTDLFDPTHLEITSIDVGNPTSNVIPGEVSVKFNVRYTPLHTFDSLKTFFETKAFECVNDQYEATWIHGAEPFYCHDQTSAQLLQNVVHEITGINPVLSTTGGTSDGRFMKDICSVMEFGLVGNTAHQINECVRVDDLVKLKDIYFEFLNRYFKNNQESNSI